MQKCEEQSLSGYLKKTDSEKPCIITSKFSDKTVKILSCFMLAPYHAFYSQRNRQKRDAGYLQHWLAIEFHDDSHIYYTLKSHRSAWQHFCWQFSLGAVCLEACWERVKVCVCVFKFSVRVLISERHFIVSSLTLPLLHAEIPKWTVPKRVLTNLKKDDVNEVSTAEFLQC